MKKHIFVLIGLAALLMGCNNGKNAGTAEAQPANGSENQVVAADTAVKAAKWLDDRRLLPVDRTRPLRRYDAVYRDRQKPSLRR